MNNNKIKLNLAQIQDAVNDKTKIEDIDFDNLIVIKRDGRFQKWDVNKMRKVCLWACDNIEAYANDLLNSTSIKLYNHIKISDVYDELIKTAANKISRIYPIYENIAAKLYLLKVYRNHANIKTNNQYPKLKDIIKVGIEAKIYDPNIFNSYTEQEIDLLNKEIKVEYDYLFTYKSLNIFAKKYCLNVAKNQKLELPQHAYMRIAMSLFYKENKQNRLNDVIKFYHYLAQHYFTVATPIMLNAGTTNMQLSSCVLSCMNDSAFSIMDSVKDVAIYSKNKGGNAVDISALRAAGSYILGNNGVSSGPVPFLKILESTIKAFDQGSHRVGVCCVYYPWWHYNFNELIVLKSNSGTEENRARHLKYAVKINQLLIDRALKDQMVTLFNPVDVPNLTKLWGNDFNKAYEEYEKNPLLRVKQVKAKYILEQIMKQRIETGNIYLFHIENVNKASMLNRFINSSNLCTEIVLPSRPSELIDQKFCLDSSEYHINKSYKSGEIALCNLSSINLVKYAELDPNFQQEFIYLVTKALDNTIDIAFYPVIEAEISNKLYRYLGIGVLNYTNYLANNKININDKQALYKTHEIFEQLSYHIINASCMLAKEKGKYAKFNESKWNEGYLPFDLGNKKAIDLVPYELKLKDKWEQLRKDIKLYGIRNATLMAIAPTATSGKAINATESIEPIQDYIYKEDGVSNIISLAPNLTKNSPFYTKAFDVDQLQLVRLAAIRQIYLDQAQSINLYFNNPESMTDLWAIHLYGFSLGIKTYYYAKTNKKSDESICESCS